MPPRAAVLRTCALALLASAAVLAGCQSAPYQRRRPVPTSVPPPQQQAPPSVPVPAPETPAVPPAPAQPAPKRFQLGAAAAALIAAAHTQAAQGNPALALATIERALRIEPSNPLLWIELGRAHEAEGNYTQAGNMGRKALQLAVGDPHAQAEAWHLIADSLRARDLNQQAAQADAHASALAAQ